MRLAVLVLVLVAAAFYVSPLRAFFAAQDGYFSQRAALSVLQAENRTLHRQISEMHSATYVERQARKEYGLVPTGLQAFVVRSGDGSRRNCVRWPHLGDSVSATSGGGLVGSVFRRLGVGNDR